MSSGARAFKADGTARAKAWDKGGAGHTHGAWRTKAGGSERRRAAGDIAQARERILDFILKPVEASQ